MRDQTLKLMDLFRQDMSVINKDNPATEYPAFKNRPTQFKYQNHVYLFSIWLAGLDRGSVKP